MYKPLQTETKTTPEQAQVTLGDLLPAAMTFVVLTVALAIGAQVLNEIDDDFATDSEEANISNEGKAALLTIGEKLGILATVIVLGAVLTVIVGLVRLRFT